MSTPIKNIRLNKGIRTAILQQMIDAFVRNKLKNTPVEGQVEGLVNPTYDNLNNLLANLLENEETVALEKLWEKTYGPLKDVIAKLPDCLLGNGAFSVTCEDDSGLYYSKILKNKPGKRAGVDAVISKKDWDEAFSKCKHIRKIQSELLEDVNGFRVEVRSILESVQTTKKLIELWPNAEGYIPKSIANPNTINLPAISTGEIDAKLGI